MPVREFNASIATAGVAVTPVASNPDRLALVYGNVSTGVLMFSGTAGQVASATVGIPVAAGATFTWPTANPAGERGRVPNGPITVWGATAGQTFYVAEGALV